MSDRLDDRFLFVELKPQTFEIILDLFLAFLQILFARMNEDEIIHVSDVKPYPQFFLDEVIQAVK